MKLRDDKYVVHDCIDMHNIDPLWGMGPIASAMNSSAGRAALAQAMAEPIKTALNYQSIGRRLLTVEELPSTPTVEELLSTPTAKVISRRENIPN